MHCLLHRHPSPQRYDMALHYEIRPIAVPCRPTESRAPGWAKVLKVIGSSQNVRLLPLMTNDVS